MADRRTVSSYADDVRITMANAIKSCKDEYIKVPPYLIDYTLLTLIRKDNVKMLKLKLEKNPDLIKKYFYKETYEKRDNCILHSVIVATLIGHAFIYYSVRCLELLLQMGAIPNDYAYIISIWKPGTPKAKIFLTMTSSISCMTRKFVTEPIEKNVALLNLFHEHEVDLTEARLFQRNSIEAGFKFQSRCYTADFLKHIQTELIASKNEQRKVMSSIYTQMIDAYSKCEPKERFMFDISKVKVENIADLPDE